MPDKIGERVCDFLFLPEDDRWLTILRTGLGAEVILYGLSLRSSWGLFFGHAGTGFLGSEVSEALLRAEGVCVPSLRWITTAAAVLGIDEGSALRLVWFLLITAGCLLTAGLFCRTSAVITWLLHLCLAKSGGFNAYGVDSVMTIGLFYLMLAPLPDRASLDARLTVIKPSDPSLLGFFRRVLQVHLCLIYFFGGLTKLLGSGWWNGASVWRALTRPPFDHVSPELLVHWRALLPSLGISVWAIELLYVVFIWPRRTRMFWLSLVVTLHLGVAFAMGLYLFSLVLIILNLAAFAPALKWERVRARKTDAPAGAVAP